MGSRRVARENHLIWNSHCSRVRPKTESELIARMIHESLATTVDMTVLPVVLGCCTLRRTSFRYASASIPRWRGTVARWHGHLQGLATAIHEASGLGEEKYNGQQRDG
jgi:hypothetical protein